VFSFRPAADADARVVTRAKQGDRNAFAQLYRERLDGVSRYVGAMVRDASRTEDVVAQTFMLAWRDLPRLRKPERFDAWLYKIAHNQAIVELRRPHTTSIEDAPEPSDEDHTVDPQRHLDSGHDVAILRDALRSLPGQQRQVIQLRFFQELSSAEVARQLGKTEQAVYALQYRAITALREFVEQDAAFTIASPFATPQPSPFRRVA
jgi:RNA polymerase sigma-70 factor (ECF subfamily)